MISDTTYLNDQKFLLNSLKKLNCFYVTKKSETLIFCQKVNRSTLPDPLLYYKMIIKGQAKYL